MTLRVLSLNIWNHSGDWDARCAGIRDWIARLDPDVIGLQEVLRGAGRDQLGELFPAGGVHTAYARATDFWEDRSLEFGNAVVSRWPITDRQELELPGGDGERRVALSVTIDAPFGPLGLSCTHLSWRPFHGWIREHQVQAVCAFARRMRPRDGFPPLVVGDFNAEPGAAEIRYMTGLQSLDGQSVYFEDAWRRGGDGGPGITISSRNANGTPLEPDRRIDYVFAGPPRPDGVGLIEACRVVCDEPASGVWPSDHFGVYAELRTDPL